MTMVVSHRQRIHYRFEGDKGAYLLLHHGLFGSHQDWYDAGYVDALRDEFRLIVMDARGHGRSDRPLEPAQYALGTLVDDVIAVMDELEIRNLHFFGYSLGALVGFELLMRHPERVRIVMLGGESPFLGAEVQAQWRELADVIGRDGLGAVRRRLVDEQQIAGEPFPEQEGDALAAQALLRSLADEVPRPDEGRISVDSPVALFTGEDDPALERMRDARRRIHRARFVSVPGKSRAGLFLERETLVAEIVRLLRPTRRDGAGEEGPARSGRGERGPRSGRGRGRGRGHDQPPAEGPSRPQVPLTPPPPVEVPEARSAAEPPGESAAAEPPAGTPDAPPADRDTTGGPEQPEQEPQQAANADTTSGETEAGQAPDRSTPEEPPADGPQERREDDPGRSD